MTLGELRTLFVTLSGRDDLVGALADPYIQAGQMQLDLWQDIPNKLSLYSEELPVNYDRFAVANCRGIEQIWIRSDSSTYSELDEYDLSRFLDNLSSTAGAPSCFTRILDASDPTQVMLLFDCPASVAMRVDVYGHFYTPQLVYENDTNWWSVMHGMTLVHAALYKLEVSYRNSEGANDWKRAIFEVLDGIDRDAAEMEIPTGKLVMGRR